MKYRKKPIVIEAVQWRGSPSWDEIKALAPDRIARDSHKLDIMTLEGLMAAAPGDWIIKGVAGEVYPCKPDIFEQTYEAV